MSKKENTVSNHDTVSYFMDLVKVEYEAIELMKEGYSFKLLVNDESVNELGRVVTNDKKTVKCTVQITKGNETVNLDYEIAL